MSAEHKIFIDEHQRIAKLGAKFNIVEPFHETRPVIVGTHRGLQERSLFTEPVLEWVKEANNYLTVQIKGKLSQSISQRYQEIRAKTLPKDLDQEYWQLEAAISETLAQLLDTLASENLRLLLAFKIAWDASGEFGMEVALSQLEELPFLIPEELTEYKSKDHHAFTASYGDIGRTTENESFTHCPFHSFATAFEHELANVFLIIEITHLNSPSHPRGIPGLGISINWSISSAINRKMNSLLKKNGIRL